MRKWSVFVFMAIISVSSIYAQQMEPAKKWHYLIEPYIMFPNMSGDIGMSYVSSVEVDADVSDIFSRLQFGSMLYLEANNGKWAITSDFLYMHLEQDTRSGRYIIRSGEVTAKQLSYELGGLYRLNPFLEVGIAMRLNSISSDLALRVASDIPENTIPIDVSNTEVWVDPVIVGRLGKDFGERWFGTFRGDIGGFGIGSDLTWQIQAYVGYRISRLLQLSAGYRVISMDYEHGNGNDYFMYDIRNFGPNIRIGFNL